MIKLDKLKIIKKLIIPAPLTKFMLDLFLLNLYLCIFIKFKYYNVYFKIIN